MVRVATKTRVTMMEKILQTQKNTMLKWKESRQRKRDKRKINKLQRNLFHH